MANEGNIFYKPKIENYIEDVLQSTDFLKFIESENLAELMKYDFKNNLNMDITSLFENISGNDYIKKYGIKTVNDLINKYHETKILNNSDLLNKYPGIPAMINSGLLSTTEAIVLMQFAEDNRYISTKIDILQDILVEKIGDMVIENVPDFIIQKAQIFFNNVNTLKEDNNSNTLLITKDNLKCLVKAINNTPSNIDKTKDMNEIVEEINNKINNAIPDVDITFPLKLMVYMLLSKAVSLIFGELSKLFRCKFEIPLVTWTYTILGYDVGQIVGDFLNNKILIPINKLFKATIGDFISEIEYFLLKNMTLGFAMLMNKTTTKSKCIIGKEDNTLTETDYVNNGVKLKFINKYTIYDAKMMYIKISNTSVLNYAKNLSDSEYIEKAKEFCETEFAFPSCDPITCKNPLISFIVGTGMSGNNGFVSANNKVSKCYDTFTQQYLATQMVGTSTGVCDSSFDWNSTYANTAAIIANDLLSYIATANSEQANEFQALYSSISQKKQSNLISKPQEYLLDVSSVTSLINSMPGVFSNTTTREKQFDLLKTIQTTLVNLDAQVNDLLNNVINPFIKKTFCCVVFLLLSVAGVIVNYYMLYSKDKNKGKSIDEVETYINYVRAFLSEKGRIEIVNNSADKNNILTQSLTMLKAIADILNGLGLMIRGTELNKTIDTSFISSLIDQMVSEYASFFSTIVHSTVNTYMSMIGITAFNIPELKQYIQSECYQAEYVIKTMDLFTMKIPTFLDKFIAQTFNLPLLKSYKVTIKSSVESYTANIMIELANLIYLAVKYTYTVGLCYSDDELVDNAINDILNAEQTNIIYSDSIYNNIITQYQNLNNVNLIAPNTNVDDIVIERDSESYGLYDYNSILRPLYAGNTITEILLDGSNSIYGSIYDKLLHKNGAFTAFANEVIKNYPLILHNMNYISNVKNIDMTKIVKYDNINHTVNIDWDYLAANNLHESKFQIRDKIMKLLNLQ